MKRENSFDKTQSDSRHTLRVQIVHLYMKPGLLGGSAAFKVLHLTFLLSILSFFSMTFGPKIK